MGPETSVQRTTATFFLLEIPVRAFPFEMSSETFGIELQTTQLLFFYKQPFDKEILL